MSLADSIYTEYPRHVNAQKGKKAIEKYLKRRMEETGESLFQAHVFTLAMTKEFAERQARAKTEMRFTPHPATWYNRDGPGENPQGWGPDLPEEKEAPSRGSREEIDPIWVAREWDRITEGYNLKFPDPFRLSNLPPVIQSLIKESWEDRSLS